MKAERKSSKYSFSYVKYFNSPNSATLNSGRTVYRSEKIFVPKYNKWVVCAPYDNHFIYLDPTPAVPGDRRWLLMCTCGSPAVIVGANVYKKDASPAVGGTTVGEMIVCYFHMNRGRHAEGST